MIKSFCRRTVHVLLGICGTSTKFFTTRLFLNIISILLFLIVIFINTLLLNYLN